MSYRDLDRYALEFGAPRDLMLMHAEIRRLLGITATDNLYNDVNFFYYKKPFNEDTQDNAEREIIVFTKAGYVIQAKTVYDSNNKIEGIKLEVISIRDIDKIAFISSTENSDYDVSLELRVKKSSTIKLNSRDANSHWAYQYAEQIRAIAKYLITDN